MSRLESQMEDALGIPPVPVAPNLAQQSADLLDKEIQQAEKDFGVIKPPQDKQIQLPKELESQIEESTRSPLTDFGTSDTFVDVLDNYGMKKDVPTPLRTELNERGVPVPVESLKPKLRPKSVDPTLPYGVAPESSLRPQLRPESNEVDENSFRGAIEYIINMGYLLQHPKTGKILTGLDASNKDHQAAIIGFFKQASPGFNPKKANGTLHSWCAVFVHHVLANLGVDTLGPDQGEYGPRRSANAYRNYGTKVDGLENAQEGDIIVWDFNPDDGKSIGSHVAFYAGDRITKQGGDLVNVVGGNQGGQVSLRDQESLYNKKNIVAIRRITRNDITLNLTKELAKQNPTFQQFFEKGSLASKPEAQLNKGGLTRSHPSAMTADEYYDAESKRLEEEDQTEESLSLSSVPFYERPLDADVTDKQVGGFGEGETPIFRTILGNTYTVSRNPDQRTSRTKFKEDVVPAIKKFADDPRLPTKDELVSAGKAVGESVVDTVSTPKRLFTGEQSPTETQMGDAFDIAGGTALGASVMEAPKGAIRSFAGREGDPGGPTYKDRTGPYIDRQVTASFDPYSTVSKKTLGELYSNFNDVIDSDPDYPDPNATPEALKVLSDTPLRDVISIFKKIYNADGTRKLSDSEEETLVKRYLALSRQFASKYPNTINPVSGDAYKLRPNTPQFDVLKNSTELFKFYISLMKSVRDDKEQMYFDNPFTDAGSNDPKSEIFKYNVKDVESEFPVAFQGIDVAGGLDNLPTHLQQAVIGGRSLSSLKLSQNQTVKFRQPIIEVVNTIKMKPMKIQGETFDTMLGRDFLTALQKSPAIGKDSYSQILIDPDQRYTRDDLRKIVSSDEYNVNGIDFGSGYKHTQRQRLVGFEGGREVGYFEMPILTTTPEKGRLPYSPKPTTVRMGSAHFDHEDIAHFRGSIIDPEGPVDGSTYLMATDLDRFNSLVEGKKYLLIEEIQSDILQQGYLRDATELPKKNFKMFLQEVDSQETDNPTKVRYDTAKKFGFNAEELFGKADQEALIDLDPSSPIANSERRAIRDDIIEKYKKAKLAYSKSTLVPMALDQKFPTMGQLIADYNFYGMLAKQLPEDSKRVVKPPISSSKNYKQVTDEVLKAAISKAVQSGASRIVIPSVSRFAVIRGIDKENPPKVFSSLYDKDLKKTLMELKENYPSVGINYDVLLPYTKDGDLASFDPVNDDPVDFKLGDPKGIVIDLSALMQEKELRYPRQFNKGGLSSGDDKYITEMEDMMAERYPTGGDPSIIDPTTGKPYDDSSRMRQQAEITRQTDAMEDFQSDENRIKLPKLLEEKITPLFNKPEINFSTQELEEQYKDYDPQFGKADELDEYGMKRYVSDRSSILTEPNLNTYNTSLIDVMIDAGFLLRNEAQGVTNEKALLSNFNKREDKDAVIGFLEEALGPGPYGEGFDINTASWCAAFVNHILGIAGFDQLKYGPTESEERYNKIRANAYLNYGTPVDGLENAKEGDLIIWDLVPNDSDAGTHITFYAGDRYGKQGVGDSVDVVGGNHGFGKVSLKGSGDTRTYVKRNIRGIVRVTKNNITQEFVNELADIDPIFKPFKDSKGLAVSLRPQLRPKSFNEGGAVVNLERQMDQALGGQMEEELGSQAETVDPVSGNDVPPGSLPEEVRDDIDARLSEGEYVVPADVVRYFGVKFFEDLRSQAKMGLQQMDADGRIGGDPIPPEDSMEIAELKAELSESGMYAGGLTDGGGLDIFIDDASRSPMVNGRMRARGATVNMAVGGLAVGNYGDVTKVDGIIQKLMTAANKDPALMQKLASKGIKINNTSADKKSAEMKQANKPQEPTDPVKMQEGGLPSNDDLMATATKTNPFLKKYSTLGGTAFEPMLDDFEDMNDEDKAALEAFTDPSGVIKEVFLVDAEGNKFTVAWNTAMPVPEGFTLEEIPEGFNATEPVYPAGTVINPVVQTERRTGDDGPNFPEAFSTSGSTGRSGNLSTSGLSSAALIGIDTDYKNMETGDLEAAYETLEKRFGNSTIFGVVGGALLAGTGLSAFVPLLTTGSKLAAKKKKQDLKKEIVKRYAEKRDKIGSEYSPDNFFGKSTEVKGKYLANEQGALREELDTLERLYNEEFAKEIKDDTVIQRVGDFLLQPFESMLSKNEYTDIMEAAEAYQKQLDPNAQVSPVATSARESRPKSTVQEQIASVKENTAKGKGIREAARFAAQRSAERFAAQQRQQQRNLGYDLSGKSDQGRGYVDSFKDNPNYVVQGNTVYSKEKDGTRGGAVGGVTEYGGTYGTTKSYRDAVDAKNKANEDRYEQARSDFFSNIFDKGGLVAKPAAKKQKKRTTQRRKGLGSRP